MLRTDWDGSIITGKGYRKRVGYRCLGDPKGGITYWYSFRLIILKVVQTASLI